MRRLLTIFFLSLSLLGLVHAGEPPTMTVLTDRNGLSQNSVRFLTQDHRGFLWMGTINGLCRYNGRDFLTIHPRLETSAGVLHDSRIRSIIEDQNGLLWVRTVSETVFCYDPTREQMVDFAPSFTRKTFTRLKVLEEGDVWLWGRDGFCRVSHQPDGTLRAVQHLANENIVWVEEDANHDVYVGTTKRVLRVRPNGEEALLLNQLCLSVEEYNRRLYFVGEHELLTYDLDSGSFLPARQAPWNTHKTNISTVMLADGLMLMGMPDKVYAYDTSSGRWIDANTLIPGGDKAYLHFMRDNRGRVWAYNMTGTLWRHVGEGKFQALNLIPADVLSTISQERYEVCQDSHGTIWISTFGNGLFTIDGRTGQMEHYTTQNGLPTNYLFCVMEDSSGEIWVGTELSGVVHLSPEDHSYRVFKPNPTSTFDRSNAIRLLYQDRTGHYWLGTRDGTLYELDSHWNRLQSRHLADGLPYTMAEDTLGYRYVGTKGGGLLALPTQGPEQHYYLRKPERGTEGSNDIFSFLSDDKGRMWIANFGGGLQLCHREADGRLTFRRFNLGNTHLNRARSIVQDSTGQVFLGTDQGIVTFRPDELIDDEHAFDVLHIRTTDGQVYDEVKVIYKDGQGRIWMGATGGGLNLLERHDPLAQSTFQHFGTAEGLLSNTVQAIQEDLSGYIWVSTESGISRLDLEQKHFENLITSSGARMTTFNEMASWRQADGTLLYGGYDGLYMLNPDEVMLDSPNPPVIITGIQVDGNAMAPGVPGSPLTESITTTRQLTLRHDQNNINIECVLMNYREPELNQYTYYLEGYEPDWNPSSLRNVATYRNLPPGRYTFHIKGCNSYGVWNSVPTSLDIRILPPWWRSWWAYTLYALLGVLAAIVAVRVLTRMERLRMAVAVEQQMTEYKLRFFTNISHEFRTPLTIIQGVVDDLVRRADPAISRQMALLSKSTRRLMRLIDQLLEFRKVQGGKAELHLQPTPAESFLHDIFLNFQDMARQRGTDYRFESNVGARQVWLDRGKVDKMAYNLLSNAFRYTPAPGQILMRLEADEATDRLKFSVSDNGPGVSNDQRGRLFRRFEQVSYAAQGTGIGLNLTAELSKVHHGSVDYSPSEMGGACFTISLPLSDADYSPTDKLSHDAEPAATSTALTTDVLPDEPAELLQEAKVSRPYQDYRLLAVDDDPDVLSLLKMQLGSMFTIDTATNGLEALAKMREQQPDLVVCDIMMPQMDGFAFTRRVRADHDISHIPIILLTAFISEGEQLKGIQAGADAYVTKPFSMQYLTARVVKLIEQRERLHRRFAAEPGTMRPLISTTDWDKALMDKIEALVEKNLGDAEFKLEAHITDLGLGRTTFFNKLKALTGCTPNEYVRVQRLKRAAELLASTQLNISEVGYQVGIDDPYYFSKSFKNQFGQSPTQYRKDLANPTSEANDPK